VNKVKVPVAELKPGMFVCELDRPWLDTPFLLQGINVRGDQEIDELRRYCQYVYVDPDKSVLDVQAQFDTPAAGLEDVALSKPARTQFHPHPIDYRDTITVDRELPTAKQVRESMRELMESVAHDIRVERVLNQERFKEAVQSMVESIIRNPDALFLLTKLKEANTESYGRAIEVTIYILSLARHLGFPKDEMEILGMGGLLMDVGKSKLPPIILTKHTPLTGEEHKVMKTHVQLSSEILAQSQWIPAPMLDMVLTHHEREDGSGYPRGLRGAQVGIYGKIAGIADCYEDLTTQQAFAPPLAPYAALKILMGWKGRLFNDDLVEEFVQCMGVYPVGSLVELKTGEVAIVMANNRVHRLKPQVMVILDPKKKRCREPTSLDLGAARLAGGPDAEIARGLEQGAFGVDPKEYYL
jgi:HD-GYP domain-containing protein (c-di-GMP phosphodiesterase class II)